MDGIVVEKRRPRVKIRTVLLWWSEHLLHNDVNHSDDDNGYHDAADDYYYDRDNDNRCMV